MRLSSTSNGTVVSVHPFDIHGQPNVAVRFRVDGGGESVHEARLAAESVEGDPQPGDRIAIQMVLGEAFEIRRI